MELMRLDPVTFHGDMLIEGYTSLIWTERFREPGDFELKTPRVAQTLGDIPDGSLVSLRDESYVVMLVESTTVGVNENGVAELTVKGRTFETFLERRWIGGDDFQDPWPMLQNYTAQDAALVWMWNSIDNTSGYSPDFLPVDVTIGPDPVFRPTGNNIDHVVMSDSVTHLITTTISKVDDLYTTKEWTMSKGPVYNQLIDILTLGNLGIRVLRPRTPSAYVVAGVNGPTAILGGGPGGTTLAPGQILKGTDTIVTNMRFDVYNGRNRSIYPSSNDPLDPVIFRYDVGDIQNPQYLWARNQYFNHALVTSSEGSEVIWIGKDSPYRSTNVQDDTASFPAPGPGPEWPVKGTYDVAEPEGLERYSTIIDLGDISDVDDPTSYMTQQGYVELKKKARQIMVDGSIAVNSDYKFGVHYGLGDLVTVIGQYGVSETMVVNEYIRTEDQDGVRGYPTLIRKEA